MQQKIKPLYQLISDAMQEKGLSIRDVAKELDITYEHVRRISRGLVIPARHSLKPICDLLGIDYTQAELLMKAQKMEQKFGAVPVEFIPHNMQEVSKLWRQLNDQQQADALAMLKVWAKKAS